MELPNSSKNPFKSSLKLFLSSDAGKNCEPESIQMSVMSPVRMFETPAYGEAGNFKIDVHTIPSLMFSVENLNRQFFPETPLENHLFNLEDPFWKPEAQDLRPPHLDMSMEKGEPQSRNEQNTSDQQKSSKDSPADRSKFILFRSTKIAHLGNLFNILIKHFLNLSFDPEDFQLSKIEISLTALIIHRKLISLKGFYPFAQNYDITLDQLFELIEKSKQVPSQKRPEENTKFIFKLTFKQLKDKYKKQNPAKASDDLSFYAFYFSGLTNSETFDEFKDPLLSKGQKKKGEPKTLNKKYLRKLFKSESFKKDFLACINSYSFILDYQKTIQKKIEKSLLLFEKKFKFTKDNTSLEVHDLQNYILKEKSIKLPWTIVEINTATKYFGYLVNSFDKN